ncbi:MAG: CGLD27 family protein [Cyanophyceae cyanobacterium]
MKQTTSTCPVPQEQQPINEYEELKEAWFFRWVSLSAADYWRKLFWVWAVGWLVAGPITAVSFPPQKEPILFGLSSGAGAGLLVVFIVLRLYLGWSYVGDRLQKETVVYEESGWYDGQVWHKPPEVLTRDRLIATYQVEPMLTRLKQTTFVLLAFIGGASTVWFWSSN